MIAFASCDRGQRYEYKRINFSTFFSRIQKRSSLILDGRGGGSPWQLYNGGGDCAIVEFIDNVSDHAWSNLQYMSERITGVEGTKLDREFEDMEKRTDLFNELVDDLQLKTKEYLQPNPTVRAKMAAVKGISKLSGQAKVQNLCSMNDRIGHALSDSKNTLHSSPSTNLYGSLCFRTKDAAQPRWLFWLL